MARVLSVTFAALPFAFGVIRALKTGTDVRYLWVALAAGIGAIAIAQMTRVRRSVSAPAFATLVFVASGATAVGAAMLLGTKLGLGILVVAASFAACFAAACLASVLAQQR